MSFDRIEVSQSKLKSNGTFDSLLTSRIERRSGLRSSKFRPKISRLWSAQQQSDHLLRTESGELEIQSLSLSVQRREISGPDDIQLQEIVVKRIVDVGSPSFFAAAAAGTTIGKLEYFQVLPEELGRSGASVRWTFDDALVRSYAVEESGGRPLRRSYCWPGKRRRKWSILEIRLVRMGLTLFWTSGQYSYSK